MTLRTEAACPYGYSDCAVVDGGEYGHKVCYEESGAWVPDARFDPNPVMAAYEVLAAGVRKVDGVLLDAFTASAIVAVAEKLSPPSRARLEQMDVVRAASICLRLGRPR